MADKERMRKEAREKFVSRRKDHHIPKEYKELDQLHFLANVDENSKNFSDISLGKNAKIAAENGKPKDRERFTEVKNPLITGHEFDDHYMDYDDDTVNHYDPNFNSDEWLMEVKETDFFNSFDDDFDDSDI